jgi:hypothetical protein
VKLPTNPRNVLGGKGIVKPGQKCSKCESHDAVTFQLCLGLLDYGLKSLACPVSWIMKNASIQT